MDDASHSLKPWVTFAGVRARHRRPLLGAGGAGADSTRHPADVRAGAAGDLAGALGGPRPGRARGRHPGVHRPRVSPAGAWRGRWTTWPRTCPRYRVNILAKIADVRGAGKGGTVEKLQETIEDIKTDLGKSDAPRGRRRAGRSWSPPSTSRVSRASRGSVRSSARSAPPALVRGDGDLHAARAPGSARPADRAVRARPADRHDQGVRRGGHARQPAAADAVAGEPGLRRRGRVGLYFLGVPYALVWAALGAALRFIPYVGPVVGAGAPILVSLAALPGLGRSALGRRPVRRARAVHEPGARNRPLCGRGGRVAGGAARLGGVLDVAVGTARPADGDAADRRAWWCSASTCRDSSSSAC